MARTWEVDFLQNRKPIEAEFKGSMAYKLPIASPEKLGGVKPIAKTEDMVQPVGVDAEGALWVKESSLRPDWNQTDEEAGDFIKNKPSLDDFQIKDFVINISSSVIDGTQNLTADKTFWEIKTAINEGRHPIMLFGGMTFYMSYESSENIGFTAIRNANTASISITPVIYLSINSNNIISRQSNQLQCIDGRVTKLTQNLTHNNYPTAKAVVDALEFKINKTDIATDEEIFEMLIQEDMVMAVTDSEGAFLSDENDNILLW